MAENNQENCINIQDSLENNSMREKHSNTNGDFIQMDLPGKRVVNVYKSGKVLFGDKLSRGRAKYDRVGGSYDYKNINRIENSDDNFSIDSLVAINNYLNDKDSISCEFKEKRDSIGEEISGNDTPEFNSREERYSYIAKKLGINENDTNKIEKIVDKLILKKIKEVIQYIKKINNTFNGKKIYIYLDYGEGGEFVTRASDLKEVDEINQESKEIREMGLSFIIDLKGKLIFDKENYGQFKDGDFYDSFYYNNHNFKITDQYFIDFEDINIDTETIFNKIIGNSVQEGVEKLKKVEKVEKLNKPIIESTRKLVNTMRSRYSDEFEIYFTNDENPGYNQTFYIGEWKFLMLPIGTGKSPYFSVPHYEYNEKSGKVKKVHTENKLTEDFIENQLERVREKYLYN